MHSPDLFTLPRIPAANALHDAAHNQDLAAMPRVRARSTPLTSSRARVREVSVSAPVNDRTQGTPT